MFLRPNFFARQSNGFTQLQPGFNAALFFLSTVVVEDALNPLPTDIAIPTIRQDCRVFDWNRGLVVKAIRHPTLDSGLVELA